MSLQAFHPDNVEKITFFSADQKSKAKMVNAGAEQMLKVGETSPQGVTLLAADAEGARLRFRDAEHSLSLSNRVAGTFKPADRQRVDISPDGLGQYRIRGAIDGQFVNFLVDTGASVVAMSARHARRGANTTGGTIDGEPDSSHPE